MYRPLFALFAALALGAAPARASDPDVTGLVPTIWWDFETKPTASQLPGANKGSASISFKDEGTATYQTGVTNGWALDTSKFTPYSEANGAFSTDGGAYTVSLVMNLGATQNGITLNLRNETGQRDLIVRRGSDTGSLVVGCDVWKVATRHNLQATFEDDLAFHLVSVVVEESGFSLYVDGEFVGSATDFTPWTATGRASRLQFGSHLSGVPSGEAKYGGCIDDLRIHDAALTTAQMKLIAAEYGLASLDGFIAVAPSGEPTVGTDSFRAPFVLHLSEGDAAEAAIVYGTDAALSAPATNVVGSALPAGAYAASLSGLASGTTYWWKLVASNGVEWAETDAASFRTLDVIVPTDYARRIPAVLSGYAGTDTLTNFPVLVKLAAGTPAGFDYADCAEGGADIRFASPDGTVLPHEIDTWNTNGESFVWVKIPAISGTATAFSMYYGASDPARLPPVDPRSVWTAAGHRAVWHFATNATESAQGLVASTASGTPSYENDGAVGKCWQSAGEAWLQYANDVSWSALGAGSTLTISAWAKFDSTSYDYNRILSTMSTWEQPAGYELTVQDDKNEITVGSSGRSQYQKVVSPGPSDEMVYLTAVYNADTYADLYVNGVLQEHKQLNPLAWPTEAMTVACVAGGGNVWNGKLDELRLHAAAESADWVKACYDTMAAPSSFVALSPAESTDPDLPRFGAVSASDANGVATFTVPLATPGYGGEVPTAVSVFFGTDGETWTELPLGSTNEAATLTASASGFAVGVRYLWYAVATATSGGTPKTTVSQPQSFVARAFDPTGDYKSFTATVVWDGAPAENLPFLLRISEGGINGFDYDDVTASGLEILDADGHLLPFEIDTWNTNGESLVWVLPPVYEDGATVTVRYGAPFANAPIPATNVWTAYVAVWHMNEILADAESGNHYTPDSSASGWHAYKSDEADAVPSPVTTASGASAHPTPLTGTAMNIAYGAGKSSSSLGGFRVPAARTSSTTLDGPGFTLSAIVNSQQIANNGRCRVIAFGTEHNDKANCSVGSDNIYCMGSNNHNKPNPNGATGWVCVTEVFGSPSFIYANGANISGNGGNPNLTSVSLTKGIGLGCFTDGKQCLDGYLDEARIRNAASTADWIAAEYHTMEDDAVSFSSVSSSDTSVPVLGIPSVARNADGSFTVSVAVSENDPASIVCLIGGTDYAMTPADASLPTTYSATVSGLVPGTHVASVHATATSGTSVSSTCPDAFHAGALSIAKLSDADEGTLSPGVFRVSRADADSTDLPALTFDVAFSGPGFAAIADPGISTATIPAGAAYVDIAVTPVPTDEVDEDASLSLAVSGTKVGLPSTASLTVVNAGFDLAVRYVSPEGDDANSGGTPETAKRTIAAAVAAVNPVATSRPCTVHVAPGLYPISSPIVLANDIRVLGDDPDPSRTVVSNTFIGGWGALNRIFTIKHTDALVANLTMQKGNVNGSDHGGNFNISSAGGTVSNCVVEAGNSNGNQYGAGARLSGGLVTHTVFRKNNCGSGMGNWQGQHGAVLELAGSARAENCLLVDNPPSGTLYLILLEGSSVMRNCTIADTGLSKTNEYCKVFTALRINSPNATVLNTVIAGVTNTVDGAPCPPTGSGVSNFLHGAFDGDVSTLPAGTVTGTIDDFFPRHTNDVPFEVRYRPEPDSLLLDAGTNYNPMAALDLSGRQPRLVGAAVDIGCYEDAYFLPVLAEPPSVFRSGSEWRYDATIDYGLGDVFLATESLFDGSAITNAAFSFDSSAQLPQTFSDAVALPENRMCRAVAVLRATDERTEVVVAARESIYSGAISATRVRDADMATRTPGIVRLSRAVTEAATCAPLTVAVELSGEAVSNGLVEAVSSVTIPAGEGSVDVEIRPVSGSAVSGDRIATLTVVGTNVANPGTHADIVCRENAFLSVEATGEPMVGLESFAASFAVDSGAPAVVSIVWSADASFSTASTNTLAEAVTNGTFEAAIGGLELDTAYWWKLVADNGALSIETAPASFRTLGAPTFGEVSESVDGATVRFSVELASVARDALGNGIRTYVTVFCTTNGTDWIERPLGSTLRPRALGGSATLSTGLWTWYARATAESGGRTFAAETGTRTFRVFHNETPPAGFHRVDIEIAYAGEAAEDIPVLLRLSEGIDGFRYADVANDGKDFLFSDGDGNRLPFEIETWNPAGESLVWVRVPVFADGTVIHMDYGASEADGTANATDVWRRYVGVWHMDEASGVVADATGHGLDATPAGNAANSVAIADGPIGTARRTATSAAKGYLSIPDYDRFGLGGTFAMSGWVRLTAVNGFPRLFSRKNSYADASGWEIEMNNGSRTGFNARGSGNAPSYSGTFGTALDAEWSRIVLVYDNATLTVYQNGAPVQTGAITAAKDNGLPLSIGCNSNGSEAYAQGAFDECRLLDGAPTAAWVAAEHAAMAPLANVVRFGSAHFLSMPVLEEPPVLAWSGSSFRYAATVDYGLGAVLLTTVDLFDGSATTNATHTFDSADSRPQALSEPVELGENRMYRAAAILRSSDGAEENLALARETVYSGKLTATWIRDADVAAMTPAIVRLSRADTAAATCAPLEVSFALSGEAVSKGLLESVVSATIPAGTNCVDVAIRPIARSVDPDDYRATLTVAGTNVANPAGTHVDFYVLHAGADPYVRYVAPNGDDGNDGALATTPKRTVASALASFSENARSSLCTVHLAPGLYPIDSPIVLTNAVRVLGGDPDPSRTVVSNTGDVGFYGSHNQRIFTVNHPDALVANLTMQKGIAYYSVSGGNFFIGSAGGTVSNCVVEAGYARDNAHAGGAYLDGGLVTHSVFRKNTCGGSSDWDRNRPGVLSLNGSSGAENCLFVDNPQTTDVSLINLNSRSAMRNCTIADTRLSVTNANCPVWAPLRINSASATVLDTVVAGVTNKVDGAPCVPVGYVSRFRNGAVDGDVAGRDFPAETVVGTAASFFRNRARGDWRPKSGGPLVNAGADYEPMAGVDLTGVQPRKVGSRVDIGCYEAFAETTILILR